MRPRIPPLALLGAILALAAAACGGSSSSRGDGNGSATPAPGGGLTIDQALTSELDGPLLVKGSIVAPEGSAVRLCSALLESYPPQCGGPSLVVEGLDLSTVAGLSETDDSSLAQVTWSDGEVSLLGTVKDGVLTVSATSQ